MNENLDPHNLDIFQRHRMVLAENLVLKNRIKILESSLESILETADKCVAKILDERCTYTDVYGHMKCDDD